MLVARVAAPATSDAPNGEAQGPGLVRSTVNGALLGVANGRAIKLLPAKAGLRAKDAIQLAPPGAWAALGRALSGRRAALALLIAGHRTPLHSGYVPSDGDRLLIHATSDGTPDQASDPDMPGLAASYDSYVRDAMKAEGRRPTTAKLTLEARLPASVRSAAVTFLLDGVPMALLNRPPYRVVWDTRDWQNGEHLIEVRALDERGLLVTRTKRLVYVANPS